MINKEEYPELHGIIKRGIDTRLEWVGHSIKAGVMCEFLPEEIKKLKINSVDYSPWKGLDISIRCEEDTIKTLKMLGIQGLRPKVSSSIKSVFYAQGEGKLPDGTPLSVFVSNIDEPEGCEIKEKRSWKKEYVLVCAQSGEEVT